MITFLNASQHTSRNSQHINSGVSCSLHIFDFINTAIKLLAIKLLAVKHESSKGHICKSQQGGQRQ